MFNKERQNLNISYRVDEATGQVISGNGQIPKTTVAQPYSVPATTECHKYGPVKVFSFKTLHGKTVSVFAGAGREVDLESVDAIIDLEGYNTPNCLKQKSSLFGFKKASAQLSAKKIAYIHIPTPDYQSPKVDRIFWDSLVEDLNEMAPGKLLVCCMGGHGRTGTALAILASLLDQVSPKYVDPVDFIRDVYCTKAVESTEQIKYIGKITGQDIISEAAKLYTNTTTYGKSEKGYGLYNDDWKGSQYAEWDETLGKWVDYKKDNPYAGGGEGPVSSLK